MSRVLARPSLPWLSLLSRFVGAAVFGWAALSKIGDPAATARAVRAYRLLPESLVGPVAHALPAVELVLAALLLVGLATRVVGFISSAAVAVFIAAVSSAGIRGLKIDCGCFGGGGLVTHTHYLLDITRDAGLLLLLIAVPLIATSPLSIDSWLDGRVGAQRPGTKRERLAAARAAAVATARKRQRVIASAVASICLVGAAVGGNVAAAASTPATPMAVPAGATASGGILVGSASAAVQLVAYEDPQCPICGEFERVNGATLQAAVTAGQVAVEYRMRSFLGVESVRADNALAAAQNEGRFEALRAAMYAHQPQEHTGGFTTADLLSLGRGVGLDDAAYVDAVKQLRYARWVAFVDVQASKDGDVGTPELVRDGQLLTQQQTFDPTTFKAALGIE